MKRKNINIDNLKDSKRLKTEIQNKERNERLHKRNMTKQKLEINQLYSTIIQQKINILKNILYIYKKYSERKNKDICEILCNNKCKNRCNPILLTDKEIRSIVKIQILTERPLKIYLVTKYNEYIHFILCLRIFIKYYFDTHLYLSNFCTKICKYNNLIEPNWLSCEYFICNKIQWNFSIFS